MALRSRDYYCPKCGNSWFEVVSDSEDAHSSCCGRRLYPQMGAPAIKFRKPYFNRALGVHIKDARHEEEVLRNRGAYRPSKNDMYKAIDGGAIEDNHPKFNEAGFKAIAEKTFSELRSENQIDSDGADLPNRRIRRSVE